MTRTRTVVAKLIMFDVAMKILRQLSISRSGHRRSAAACVDFIETQLEDVAKTRKRK